MNDDFIKDLYDIYKTKYQDIKDNDVNYFKNLLTQSEDFRNDVYKEQSKNWSDLTPDLYNELIGVKKKDASASAGQENTSKSPLGETIAEKATKGDQLKLSQVRDDIDSNYFKYAKDIAGFETAITPRQQLEQFEQRGSELKSALSEKAKTARSQSELDAINKEFETGIANIAKELRMEKSDNGYKIADNDMKVYSEVLQKKLAEKYFVPEKKNSFLQDVVYALSSGGYAFNSTLAYALFQDGLGEHQAKAAQQFASYMNEYDKDITGLVKQGDMGKAIGSATKQFAQSLPTTLGLAVAAMSRNPNAVDASLATLFSGTVNQRLDETKYMDVPFLARFSDALVSGGAEIVFEKLGTINTVDSARKLIQGLGKEKGEQILKDTIEYNMGKSMNAVSGAMNSVKNGFLSEASTTWAQGISGIASGTSDKTVEEVFRDGLNDGIIGAISDKAMHTLAGGDYQAAKELTRKVMSTIPSGLNIQDKALATELILQKTDLYKQMDGKDEFYQSKTQEQIDEINDKLSVLNMPRKTRDTLAILNDQINSDINGQPDIDRLILSDGNLEKIESKTGFKSKTKDLSTDIKTLGKERQKLIDQINEPAKEGETKNTASLEKEVKKINSQLLTLFKDKQQLRNDFYKEITGDYKTPLDNQMFAESKSEAVSDIENKLNIKLDDNVKEQVQSKEAKGEKVEQEAPIQEPVVDQKQSEEAGSQMPVEKTSELAPQGQPPVGEQPMADTGSQPSSQSEMPSGVSTEANLPSGEVVKEPSEMAAPASEVITDVQQNAPFIETERSRNSEQNIPPSQTPPVNAEPPVSTESTTEPQGKVRKTVKDLQASEIPSEELKQRAEEYKYYEPTSEKESKAEVDKIMEGGMDYAYSLATSTTDKVHHSVLPPLRARVEAEYEKLALEAKEKGDDKLHDEYMDKAVEIDRLYSEEGTVFAQSLNAYKIRSKALSLHKIRRDIEANRDQTLRDNKQNVDDLFTSLKEANEGIIEALKKEGLIEKIVEDYLKTSPPTKLSKSDRIKKEKSYRQKLLADYKKNKTISATILPGLTNEKIELFGNLIASYFKQGIIEISELLRSIKRDFKSIDEELTQSEINYIKNELKVNGKTLAQIEAEGVIDSDKFSKYADKKLDEAIKGIGMKISDVAVKHFSEVDKTGRSLADKIVDSLGISEDQATKLANRIQAKFLTEVAKKKMELLDKIEKPKTVRSSKKVKGLYDKLVEFSNLGAFNKDQFKQAYADALGLPKLDAEKAGVINKYIDDIKSADSLKAQELTLDMLGYIRKNVKGLKFGELAGEMAVANMLSGIPTQERNLSYNFASYLLNAFPGQIIDLIQAKKTGTGGSSLFFKTQAKAFRQGLREAAYVMKTGKYIRPGKDVQAPQLLELTKFGKYSGLRYIGRVMQAVDMAFAVPLEEMNALYVARGLAKEQNKPVEDVLSQSQAQVQDAKEQAAKEGFSTDGVSNNIRYWKRVYEILSSQRPDELNKEASEFGDFITGKSKPFGTLGAIGDKVSQAVGLINVDGYPVGKLFLSPFIRAITNFMQLSLDYNPLINLSRLYRGGYGQESIPAMKQYNKKFTEYELAQEWAKLLISLAGIAAIIGLTFDDEEDKWFDVTGTSTGDPERDKQLRNEGRMDVALKFGDKYISMKYTPLATVIAPLGYVRDYMKYRNEELPEGEFMKGMKLSLLMGMASIKVAAESSAFANIEGFLSTLFAGEKEYERKMDQFSQGLMRTAGATSIPYYNLLNSLERFNRTINDLPMRQAESLYGKILKDLPVVGDGVSKPLLNALGDPITTNWDVIWDTATEDPLFSPLSRNNIFLSKPSKNTSIIDKSTGEERKMTDDELYNFAALTGQKLKKYMMDNMDEIKRLDEGNDSKQLKQMVDKATEKARELSKAQLSSGLKIEGLDEYFSNIQTLAQSEYFLDDFLKASNDPKATKKYGKETGLYDKASYFKENYNDIEMLRKAVNYVLGSEDLEYTQETSDLLSRELSKFNDRVKSGRTYQVSNKVLKIVEDNDLMKNEDSMSRRENILDLY